MHKCGDVDVNISFFSELRLESGIAIFTYEMYMLNTARAAPFEALSGHAVYGKRAHDTKQLEPHV